LSLRRAFYLYKTVTLSSPFVITILKGEVKPLPSNKILQEKQQQLEELIAKLKTAQAGVLVTYAGINVEQDTALRAELRKAGVEYKVLKNTMTSRAMEAVGYGEMKSELEGMTALAISQEDPVAPAKILKNYAEKIETFELKAGFVDGGYLDKAGVMALADIPSKEMLIAKMLGSITGPLYGLAIGLQAVVDQKNGGEAAAE
jgi:large subunit ribosomal protein L10